MKNKKLTQPQRNALELLSKGNGDWYGLIRVGAPGATISKLCRSGLIEECGTPGLKEWRITDSGRKTLENGYITV